MSTLFTTPNSFLVQLDGRPYPGLRAYFYRAGTTNDQAVYRDAALTTTHPQPVEAADNGRLPPIYLSPLAPADYRVIFRTRDDALIEDGDIDNIPRKRIDVTGWAPLVPQVYGALGNGVADDRAAIQAAIDAAGLLQGGTVFLPRGVYRIGGPLNLRSNIKIYGEGAASVIKWIDGLSLMDNMLKGESIQNVDVRDITLDGNRNNVAGLNQYGMFIADSSACTVTGVRSLNHLGVGIHLFVCQGSTVSGCESYNNLYHGIELEQCRDSSAIGNYLHNNARHGIYVWQGEATFLAPLGAKGLVIANNNCVANSQYGCAVQGEFTEDIVVTGNVFRSNGQYGLTIFDRVKGAVVSGNLMALNGYHGLYLYACSYAAISGNRLHNNGQVVNAGYSEIMLEGPFNSPSRFNSLTGNVIRIDGVTRTAYAIKENQTWDGPNIYQGNVFDQGTAGSLAVLQADASVNPHTSFKHSADNMGIFNTSQGASVRRNYNRATFNGGLTTYQIAHGLTPDEPRFAMVSPGSPNAAGDFSVAWDATFITVTYAVAPPAGTSNVILNWFATT